MKELEKNELLAIDGGNFLRDAWDWTKNAAVDAWEWCKYHIAGLD